MSCTHSDRKENQIWMRFILRSNRRNSSISRIRWHLKFLLEERNIKGVAHETGDTDAGFTKSFECESYVFHSGHLQIEDLQGSESEIRLHFQIELIDNVEKLPESGALVIIGVPKMKSGSGFPCRVYAVLPK